MASTTYTIRIVCDETDPAVDYTVISLAIDDSYLDIGEKVINFLIGTFGLKFTSLKVVKYLLVIAEYLGITLEETE